MNLWKRFDSVSGWIFRYKMSKAHFAISEDGSYRILCNPNMAFGETVYFADIEFPKCKNCLRMLKSNPDMLVKQETEIWSGAENSSTAHYFEFEDGQWRSACGMTRRADQFVDGDFVKCRKCLSYSNNKLGEK